jgi:hypothetical protein
VLLSPEQRERLALVQQELDVLTPDDQRIIEPRYRQRMKVADIAHARGLVEITVRRPPHRGDRRPLETVIARAKDGARRAGKKAPKVGRPPRTSQAATPSSARGVRSYN